MKVLVLGATGWIGRHYYNYFNRRGFHTIGYDSHQCDITNLERVRQAIETTQPGLVINCAGKTHSDTIPNIDGCIESLAARNETALVNVVGAGNVAQVCNENRVKLVHIGSGCIFDGYEQVFTEESEPNPPSYYALTKLQGDRAVLARNPDALVLRIRMPISGVPHPRNLITKLASAKQVIDVENTVTVVEDLVKFTEAILPSTGIVHAVHPQSIHFRELMKWYYCEHVNPDWSGEFIPKEQYKTRDGRSNAIVLSNKRPKMKATRVAIKSVLNLYARNLNQATVL